MLGLAQKFESPRTGKSASILSMEGLRGFAVFLVFLVHFVSLGEPWILTTGPYLRLSYAVYYIGNVGVDLFFVLSGYLIYGSLMLKPQPFLRFIKRRAQRIYPTFLAVFLLYCLLFYLMPEESSIPKSLGSGALYLVQNLLFLPGLFDIEPMISVAWSLSYEAFFYLAIPVLIVLLNLRERTATWRVGFFLIASAIASFLAAYYGGPFRLVVFVSGMLLFEAMQSQRLKTPSSLHGWLALIIALAVTPIRIDGEWAGVLKTLIHASTFFVLCLSCFREPTAFIARAFSWTPLRYLGNMSYSYYLLHGLTLKACFTALARILPPQADWSLSFWLLLAPAFVLSLIPTGLLYLLVERPMSLQSVKRTETRVG